MNVFGVNDLNGMRQKLVAAEVDHYLPFALYPRDLAHNFVLAHPVCNRSKSDFLAARLHLEHWLDRMEKRADAVTESGVTAGVTADGGMTKRVIAWANANAVASGAHARLSPSHYEPIGDDYIVLL